MYFLGVLVDDRATDGHGVEEIMEITREMKEPHKQLWENVKNFVRTRWSPPSISLTDGIK